MTGTAGVTPELPEEPLGVVDPDLGLVFAGVVFAGVVFAGVVFAGVVFAGVDVLVDFDLVVAAAFEGVDPAGVEPPDDPPASRNGFGSAPRRVSDVAGTTVVSDASS
ncbi:MAG TPA: hypothetical protein VII50_08135, partial [Acidothermaceae bacterium]